MTEQFESLKTKLNHIGMMGQWYQRYDIAKSAQEANKIIDNSMQLEAAFDQNPVDFKQNQVVELVNALK